jgi:pyrimidine-nucleoside phosphorylase
MDSIPGFHSDLTTEEFIDQLRRVGLVLAGQTDNMAPADGKLYALRDVTGTIKSIPLIASSIMSKKIAAGAQAIVLDVKWGNGAFMSTLETARELSKTMVHIARLSERKAVALLSDMNQPLGQAVGNALEVREAIDTLRGGGPEDFYEHCVEVASHMVILGGLTDDESLGRRMVEEKIGNGQALERLRELVQAQGGDVSFIDEPDRLPKAAIIRVVPSPRSGFLEKIHARRVGETVMLLGAGRAKKGDPIDYAVGVVIHHKVGDWVDKGEPLFTIHVNQEELLNEASQRLIEAHVLREEPTKRLPLFYGVVKAE